ncbi:BQ2448_4205 [Microbotryum intermedium]|uniref:BQ2448_4205 protein n=1 Tax=Microbotryum intermedium TaxID=269621 RepID=A0A238FN94_9BASI|nr:BQ2448_4205 [Microbotryum intermedium]
MASTTASPPPTATASQTVPPLSSSKTSLQSAKTNLSYLVRGPQAGGARPASLTLRTALRSTRYVIKFVFWRLLRYFKYTLIAGGTAALAGTVIGSIVPVAGALLVPSIPVAAAMGLGTAVFKFGWRHRGDHFRQGWLVGGEGRDARADERNDAEEAQGDPVKIHPRANKAWAFESF